MARARRAGGRRRPHIGRRRGCLGWVRWFGSLARDNRRWRRRGRFGKAAVRGLSASRGITFSSRLLAKDCRQRDRRKRLENPVIVQRLIQPRVLSCAVRQGPELPEPTIPPRMRPSSRCRSTAVDAREPGASCHYPRPRAPIGRLARADERTGATEPDTHVGEDGSGWLHHDEGGRPPPKGAVRCHQEDRR